MKLPRKLPRAILIAWSLLLLAMSGNTAVHGLYLQLTDPPVVGSGVVEDDGVEVGTRGKVVIGASYSVERQCSGDKCTDVEVPLGAYGSPTLHLRGSDGTLSELTVAPPVSTSFRDEDAHAEHRLLLVRHGDFVTAVQNGDRIEIVPETPDELDSVRTHEGRMWMVVAPLMLVVAGPMVAILWRRSSR